MSPESGDTEVGERGERGGGVEREGGENVGAKHLGWIQVSARVQSIFDALRKKTSIASW